MEPVRHASIGITAYRRKVAINVVTSGEVSGHHRRAARRTHTTGDGEPSEVRPFFRQPVNVRCPDIGMPVTAEITPAPVVRKYEQNVRSGRMIGPLRCSRRKSRQQEKT